VQYEYIQISRSFGGTSRIHLQDRKIHRERNRHKAEVATCSLLLSLLANPEDEGGMLLRNVGRLSKEYIVIS
jgi:hypothetical protein